MTLLACYVPAPLSGYSVNYSLARRSRGRVQLPSSSPSSHSSPLLYSCMEDLWSNTGMVRLQAWWIYCFVLSDFYHQEPLAAKGHLYIYMCVCTQIHIWFITDQVFFNVNSSKCRLIYLLPTSDLLYLHGGCSLSLGLAVSPEFGEARLLKNGGFLSTLPILGYHPEVHWVIGRSFHCIKRPPKEHA